MAGGNQLVITYNRGRGFELGMTGNKWPEQDANQGLPDCESDVLTTRHAARGGGGVHFSELSPGYASALGLFHQHSFLSLLSQGGWGDGKLRRLEFSFLGGRGPGLGKSRV